MVINIRDFEFDENVDNGISRIFEMYGNKGLNEGLDVSNTLQLRRGTAFAILALHIYIIYHLGQFKLKEDIIM